MDAALFVGCMQEIAFDENFLEMFCHIISANLSPTLQYVRCHSSIVFARAITLILIPIGFYHRRL